MTKFVEEQLKRQKIEPTKLKAQVYEQVESEVMELVSTEIDFLQGQLNAIKKELKQDKAKART